MGRLLNFWAPRPSSFWHLRLVVRVRVPDVLKQGTAPTTKETRV